MKILLTGGTGFFGKSLLSFLNKNNPGLEKINVLARYPEKLGNFFDTNGSPFEIECFAQDICYPIQFDEPLDYVIHAAAESSKENPMLMRDVVVEGTKNILEYARLQKVKKVLFISSGAVYGKQPNDLSHVSEDYVGAPEALNPLNAYGCAKRQAENLCALYHHNHGLDFVVARCFAFIGPYLPLDSHFAIGNFMHDGLNGRPIVVKGDGATVRSYLCSDDLAEWLWMILMKGLPGEAYNVGSDEAITITDLAQMVSSCFEDKPEVIIKDKPGVELSRYVPSIEKAETHLNLKVTKSLRESLMNTISHHNSSLFVS